MRKLIVLAAFTLGVAMTHQAVACDWQREAAQAPVVVAGCNTSNCATETAKPDPDESKVACQGNGCATEEPATTAPSKLAGE
jgi:hypothetical protein